MKGILKVIKEYKITQYKKEHLLILLERSEKIQFPIYSLIQILNSSNKKPTKMISSEGWIEKDSGLVQETKNIEKEKAELKKARAEFENSKKGNSFFKKIYVLISTIMAILLMIYFINLTNKSGDEQKALNIENLSEDKTQDNTNLNDLKTPRLTKKKDVNETEETVVDFNKARDYFNRAQEKLQLNDYKWALSLIDLALKYNPDNNLYIKFKSDLKNPRSAQNSGKSSVNDTKNQIPEPVDKEVVEIVRGEEQEEIFKGDEENKKEVIQEKMSKPIKNYYEVFGTYNDRKDPYLNLRSRPINGSKILKKLKDGTKLEVLEFGKGSNNLWVKVHYPIDNITGYVHSKYIRKYN